MAEGGQGPSLASLMEEGGYRCCSSEEDIEKCMSRVEGPIREDTVAQVLAMMARTMSGLDADPHGTQANMLRNLNIHPEGAPPTTWNTDMFIAVVLARNPDISWEAVARGLDHPRFSLPDQTAFRNLMAVWAKATPEAFPLNAVVGNPSWPLWKNTLGLVQFLQFAIAEKDPSVFTFEHAQRKQDLLDGLKGPSQHMPFNMAWLCLDVIETLCRLAEVGHEASVSAILAEPLEQCPEYLVIGLASAQNPWPAYLCTLCESLTMKYLLGHVNSPIVLPHLWGMKPALVQSGLVAMFYKDQKCLPRVLQIAHVELEALFAILEHSGQVDFALGLASLAAQAGHISLPMWLDDRVLRGEEAFVLAATEFLEVVTSNSRAAEMHIKHDTLEICCNTLASHIKFMTPEIMQRLAKAKSRIIPSTQPELLPEAPKKFPAEIEQVTNDLYQDLYHRKMSVQQLIQRTKSLRDEDSKESSMVVACTLQSLLDEYKHLDKYPEPELRLTGELYGGCVREELFQGVLLGEAMKKLLACFSTQYNSNFWKFGIVALEAFQDNLEAWNWWSVAVLATPQFRECAPPALVAKLETMVARHAAENANPALNRNMHTVLPGVLDNDGPGGRHDEATGQAMGPHVSMDSCFPPGLYENKPAKGTGGEAERIGSALDDMPAAARNAFQALNTYTLEEASKDVDVPVPSQAVQDRVSFIMNNLSAVMLEQKVKELKGLLEGGPDDYLPWFANYLVVKRVAQEPNFHPLYISFVEAIDMEQLWKVLVSTTYKYIHVLLNTDRIKNNSGERTLLRNLGSWLGRLIIQRHKPLRQRDLDLKGILLMAYRMGKMIAVMPFIGKVLEPGGKDNKVYKPPNPWIMSILGLIAEIYPLDRLKLNLRFDIEMLFRNFGLAPEDVQPTSILHEHKRENVGNPDPDFQPEAKAEQPMMPSPNRNAASLQLPPQEQPPPPPVALSPGVVPGLPPPPSPLAMPTLEQQTQPFVQPPPVMQPAELAQPPPPLSGIYTNVTTRAVISPSLLPYASRENLARVVAAAMDNAIMGIINVVVERAVTISSTTVFEFVTKDFAFDGNEDHLRQAAHLAVSSLASSLALVTCREPLRSGLHAHLRKHLENVVLNGQGDKEHVLEGLIPVLLEDNFSLGCSLIEKAANDKALATINERLSPCLEARKMAKASNKSYVDVGIINRCNGFVMQLPESLRPRTTPLTAQQIRIYEDFSRVPRVNPSKQLADGSVADEGAQDEMRFPQWSAMLDDALASMPVQTDKVQPGTPVAQVVDNVLLAVGDWEHAAQLFAKQLLSRMFEMTSSKLHNHACVLALSAIHKKMLKSLPQEVTATYLNLEQSRKWRPWMVECLLRNNLLIPAELDAHMVKVLSTGNQNTMLVTEFAAHIIRECLVKDGFLSARDLAGTLDMLRKYSELYPEQIGAPLMPLLHEVQLHQQRLMHAVPMPEGPLPPPPAPPADNPQWVEAARMQLQAWVHAIEEHPCDKEQHAYVAELKRLGWLESEERADIFFRALTECGIHVALTVAPNHSPQILNYMPLDGYVRLVAVLVKVHGGGAHMLSKACAAMTNNLLRRASTMGDAFNGRPYFRFFLGLICELSPEDYNDPTGASYMEAIAVALLQVQPLSCPHFAFPWLELVSHRKFMPVMISSPGRRSWDHFHALMMCAMRLLEPYLRGSNSTDNLADPLKLMYKGILRVLLVLLHDFPEYLSVYSFDMVNHVPSSCAQLCNLILSGYPPSMSLPDPMNSNVVIPLVPEIHMPPTMRPDPVELLVPTVKAELDRYFATGQYGPFLTKFPEMLKNAVREVAVTGSCHTVQRMTGAFVLYICIKGIAALEGKGKGCSALDTPLLHTELLKLILKDLDLPSRALFINAMVNQLLYPNSHTYFFSCFLRSLFLKENLTSVEEKEQVVCALLSRLIVNRPHPWGVLVTLVELIKDPRYDFWQMEFVHCAPQITHLFENVSISCSAAAKQEEAAASQAPLLQV